ncbi:MAG: hypothetical protein ACW987_17880 [Candidatus Thorarchaeota archaeon]|jgi:hypothetical protein
MGPSLARWVFEMLRGFSILITYIFLWEFWRHGQATEKKKIDVKGDY